MSSTFLRQLTLNFTHSLEAGIVLEGPIGIKYHRRAEEITVAFLGELWMILAVLNIIL